MPSVSRRAIWTVYVIMLMDTLNFGIVFPLLPSIAKKFGASATMVGSMATIYSLCQMLATPFLGNHSDRWGRCPVLLLSVLGTTLSSAGTAYAWNFPVLIVSRCVNGISGGTVGVVNAYIADITTSEEKATYMSYVSAANSIGIILGPAVGGMLSKLGFEVACLVSAGLSAVNLLMAIFFLQESRWCQATDEARSLRASEGGGTVAPAGAGAGATNGDSNGSTSTPSAGGQEHIPWPAGFLYASGFLLVLGFASMESVTAYYLMDTFFNGDEKQAGQFYGICFMFVGIVMFLVAAICYRPLRKLLGELPLVAIGIVLRSTGFLLQPTASQPWLFAAYLCVAIGGSNLVIPTTSSMLTKMVPRTKYGRALGYQQSAQAFSRVLGPMLFGEFYDRVDHRFSFWANAATTLLAGLCICMVPKADQEMNQPPSQATEPDALAETSDCQQRQVSRDIEENVEAFERRQTEPRSGEVSYLQNNLVRSNSLGQD